MTISNKLGINTSAELMLAEEKISKQAALQLYDSGELMEHPAGTFKTLCFIHRYLFEKIYDFAGTLRTVNIAKGNFRFASAMYLQDAVSHVEKMPQSSIDEIIEKYVEMNVCHPFREGNGRAMRIWLDHILITEMGKCVDWALIDKGSYLSAMERSPVNTVEINTLLKKALTDRTDDREVFFKGLDQSYFYENMDSFRASELCADSVKEKL